MIIELRNPSEEHTYYANQPPVQNSSSHGNVLAAPVDNTENDSDEPENAVRPKYQGTPKSPSLDFEETGILEESLMFPKSTGLGNMEILRDGV